MTTTSAVIIKKTKQQEMREQLAQEKKKPNVHDFDDMSLFVLIFAEKKLNCSIYIRETQNEIESGNTLTWNT